MIDRKRVILYIMSCVQQEHKTIRIARVAQLVERDLAKVEAAGSSPVSRFSYALELVPGLFCCLFITRKNAAFAASFSQLFIFCSINLHGFPGIFPDPGVDAAEILQLGFGNALAEKAEHFLLGLNSQLDDRGSLFLQNQVGDPPVRIILPGVDIALAHQGIHGPGNR